MIYIYRLPKWHYSFHGGSDGKAFACIMGDPGSIPRSGRFPCTLVWKIPWTEELGKLQSMGSQGVGHS